MNRKAVAVNTLITVLVLAAFCQLISLHVYAVNVTITSISPATKTGKVGEIVTLVGTINTTEGLYEVWFDSILVANGTASGNNVNCSFKVPTLQGGNYTITLRDVLAGVNATSWFYVEANYIIKVSKPQYPNQFQEGATAINISVSITGGKKENGGYVANITVKTPANETYQALVHLLNTTDTGVWNASILYPDNFLGRPHTNYTGTYTVYFNGTLAYDTFFIGLTDRAEYHRGDVVRIKAVGYSSLTGTNTTISIRFGNELIANFNHTVLGDIIEANWTVPVNTLIGNYTLNITPKPDSKKVNDTQDFIVPGFKTQITPLNLAGEPVPNVLINAYDKWANATYNITSNENGIAVALLEKGEYNLTAYFKKVKVSEKSFFIPNMYDKLNITCQLTNLNIAVVGEQNVAVKIPFVSLNISVTYTMDLDGGKIENETIISQTNIDGYAQLRSLLISASYHVAALRYGKVFNLNNDTFRLKPSAWNNITIFCPVRPLTVNLVGTNNVPISNALVEVQETMGGLQYTNYTNQDGRSFFSCVFGIYNVKVSSRGVILNSTVVELFEGKTITVYCPLYNLPIYVKVIDYFGQPIPNVNVTLEREGVPINSKLTNANGIADFTEIGGTLTIKVYLTDRNQPIYSFTCPVVEARNEINPIEVKLAKYIIFAGLLVETAWFATIILIVVALAFFVLLEVRMKRFKI
ncbi:hypothetical protein KEJ24_05395 [Candidatus Bathyarchaeota archaeon]|nr:hypothetical protein [Candidatus Bathyarchaeota archaeon]